MEPVLQRSGNPIGGPAFRQTAQEQVSRIESVKVRGMRQFHLRKLFEFRGSKLRESAAGSIKIHGFATTHAQLRKIGGRAALFAHDHPISLRWCSREDSNLHGLPHTVLSRARLPIPPREL